MRWLVAVALAACSSAQWTDTFQGVDSRLVADAAVSDEPGVEDDAGTGFDCNGLAASKAPVSPITVTFPGYGTQSTTIHIVTSSATCDLNVDTTEDNVLFSGDASPCAPLLAPGTPVSSTAVASGPDQLLFQWSYGICEIDDQYVLSKQ